MDRETAVYHFYTRKNTDFEDSLRTRSGQRDSSLPFLPQKEEYRLVQKAEDKGQGVDKQTSVYHSYLRKQKTDKGQWVETKDKEWTEIRQSTAPT